MLLKYTTELSITFPFCSFLSDTNKRR